MLKVRHAHHDVSNLILILSLSKDEALCAASNKRLILSLSKDETA